MIPRLPRSTLTYPLVPYTALVRSPASSLSRPVDTAMVHVSVSLKPALDAVGQAIDQRFDRLLAVPDDPRRQLFEAMRHAAIGGGKRMRPLLVVAACDLYHVDRERALRVADRKSTRLNSSH